MAWVDWAIIVFVAIGVWQGLWHGFTALLFQIGSVVLATVVTLWTFPSVGDWLERQFQLPASYTRPLGLGVVFLLAVSLLGWLGNILHKLFGPILHASLFNRGAGMILGAARQVVIAGIVLTLLVTLPLPGAIKETISRSRLARPLIGATIKAEQAARRRLHYDDLKSVAYQTVGKDESTTVGLNYTVEGAKVDEAGEKTLLTLTNELRRRQRLPELTLHPGLREVARRHAQDMLKRGYFSHFSPSGDDALDRVEKASIGVAGVGENLSTAPTVLMAQAGLLASEGHRKNIFSPDFNALGIAVLDAGLHGKMVVELFARLP